MFQIETASRRAGFTEIGRVGRSGVWWTLGGLLFAVAAFFILTVSLVSFLVHVWPGRPVSGAVTPWYAVEFPQALYDYGISMAAVALMGVTAWLTVLFFHRRPGLTLLTAERRFDFIRLLRSMGVMIGLKIIFVLIAAALVPGTLQPVFTPAAFLPFLILSLLVLPLQVLGEEVFFRGYLTQVVGRFTRNALVILLVPALLFAVMHFFNPSSAFQDFWGKAVYVIMALYLGLLVLRSGGLELSIGVHLGSNFLAIHIFGSETEAPSVPSIFTYSAPSPMIEFFMLLGVFALHYLILFKVLRFRKR